MTARNVFELVLGMLLMLMLARSTYVWAVEEAAERWLRGRDEAIEAAKANTRGSFSRGLAEKNTAQRYYITPWYVQSYYRRRARHARRMGRAE